MRTKAQRDCGNRVLGGGGGSKVVWGANVAGKKSPRPEPILLASFPLRNTSEKDRDKAIPRILLAQGGAQGGGSQCATLPTPACIGSSLGEGGFFF